MRPQSGSVVRSAASLALLLTSLVVATPGAEAEVVPPWDPFFASPSVVADLSVVPPTGTTSNRSFGVAAGDFDGGAPDLVVGRVDGRSHFLRGNGDGTFAAPVQLPFKQTTFNAWSMAAGDINGDELLDIVWGANAASSGCTVYITGCAPDVFVNDGDVRVFYGNGDGTFQQSAYYVNGLLFNQGTLLARVAATDAGSLAVADLDGDGDDDVVAGALDGANTVVKLLRNGGVAGFTVETLISQPTDVSGDTASPTYFPATATQNSPWGLAFGDADGDDDLDLFIGDRALYVYLYLNDGNGAFTLKTPNSVLANRPNVYLRHDAYRAAVGYTPSLAAGDVNGDGRADLAVALHSSTQTPASAVVHDGVVLLDVSEPAGHRLFGALGDVGSVARGLNMLDANGDAELDLVSGSYQGQAVLLRQLPPLDSDGDRVSDYVDDAPYFANAPRLDMNTDGTITFLDQLDNDFDTVLGNPEDPASWLRLGDVADPDDDADAVLDTIDNCAFVANADQAERDGDGVGDACDPLDDRDPDGDGVPTGFLPGDPLFEQARAAAIAWSMGDTHFVIRIDALGRWFQNEFTQLMVDAGTLTPEQWASKCWESYGPGGDDPVEPCGTGEGTPDQVLMLPGGVAIPITIITIPKQLWTDPPVIDWINDRNGNPLFELGQHAAYHANNTALGDWAGDPDRNFYACETCGLTAAENFELIEVGYDTLLGNYANAWVAQSGATQASAKIDWSTSATPLISYAPPYNASDALSRWATAQLGFRSFSASRFEEDPAYLGEVFSPEGNWHESFDQYGMFHVSADWQIDPEDLDMTDAEYATYLQSRTEAGGLNTWLIEEVEWSGRAADTAPRDLSNRENNTVYAPRWERWIQLLEYVRDYPGGVAMTQGQVALAMAFDNAPTVFNPEQTDADHDGIGDVIQGATLAAQAAELTRNVGDRLSATLTGGTGNGIPGQTVRFVFDVNGDGAAEEYTATTDTAGSATVSVLPTRPVGATTFDALWDGPLGTVTAVGAVTVTDATTLSLADALQTRGTPVAAVATLTDSDGEPVEGALVSFWVETRVKAVATWVQFGSTTTDAEGTATVELPTKYVSKQPRPVRADFDGDPLHAPSTASAIAQRI